MNDNIIKVDYNDLDDYLKEKVRDHFRDDEYLVPDDWYEWVLEGISERYPGIDIESNSITIDMYRNDFGWKGTVDFDHPDIKKLIPSKYFEYEEKEIVYDASNAFKDGEMSDEYFLDSNLIYEYVEQDIFTDHVNIDFDGEGAEIDIDTFRPYFEKAIKTYNEYGIEVEEKLKEWLKLMDASAIFFQPTITIFEDDYDFIVSDLSGDLEKNIELFMENDFRTKLDEYISDIFDEFTKSLVDSYDYYYSDEHADESLSEKTFEVIVDEDGEQEEVVDLNGEW